MASSPYADFYSSRLKMRDEATDPALKAHFQAELDQVELMNGGTNGLDGSELQPGDIRSPGEPVPAGDSADAQPNPAVQSRTGTNGPYPSDGTGGWGEEDLRIGKDKIVELLPLIKEAAAKYGIPAKELAAIVLQEGRGTPAAVMRTAGGVAQIGAPEIKALAAGEDPADGNIRNLPKHPELDPNNPNSDKSQIFGAAIYLALLKDKQGGNMDMAIRNYNGGYSASGSLNDGAYMEKHAQALAILDSYGISL